MMRKWLIGGALVVVVLLLVAVGGYCLMNSRSFQLAGRLVNRVDTSDKVVALTLDDGPTDRALDVLKVLAEQQVRATFYLVGSDLAAHPEYGRAIAEAGHEIGNHSYRHRRMVFSSASTVRDEVERTDAEIAKTGYQGPITFRPPYGKKLWSLPKYLSDHDRISVTWDVEPDSGETATSDEIAAQAVREVRPGSIILLHVMHEFAGPALAAIPRIVGELRAGGYRFVTVSELMTH